jgi:hypothetical protein
VVVIVVAGIVWWVNRKSDDPASRPDSSTWNKALATLETLPVKGRAPKTGYSRDAFGKPWTDDVTVPGGHNGCDTRDDILRRDLTDPTPSRGCMVLSGTLHDPYTDTTIAFQRGIPSVQIDHVVALEDAWQTGAQQLDLQTRQNFANDPRNLQATDGPTNQAKGDRDAATWLPDNKAYRCMYVARQVDVKAIYGLWVTQAEHDEIAKLLHGCITKEAGTSTALSTPGPAPSPLPSLTPTTSLTPTSRAPRAGQWCAPRGATAVSSTGAPLVCAPASDGRNRWETA